MNAPPFPANEKERLDAVHTYAVLDTPPEAEYDAITRLASQICGTPVSLITLLDEKRQWFKSAHGTEVKETPREYAFCTYAIMEPDQPMVVPDLRRDERFRANPLVTDDPNVVFYAGVPLVDGNGFPLGSLCVLDTEAKTLTPFQLEALQTLAAQVVTLLRMRRKVKILERLERLLEERNEELQKAVRLLLAEEPAAGELAEAVATLQAVHGTTLSEEGRAMLKKAADAVLRIGKAMEKAKGSV